VTKEILAQLSGVNSKDFI